MDDSEKLRLLERVEGFIKKQDLNNDIKQKMLRVVDYVSKNLYIKGMLFEDNTNDLNPVSIWFDESSPKFGRLFYINYYSEEKQYDISIRKDAESEDDFLNIMEPENRFFQSPSDVRELYSSKYTITLPQVEETVIDVEVVEENSSTPAAEPTQPAPPPSTTEEPQPEQNADLEKLKKSLNALSSASKRNNTKQLGADKISKETIRDTVSAVLHNDEQLAQLLDKSKLLIYKDKKSQQPVLLSYNKYTDNVSAIVYNHSGRGWNYFFREERGTFIGTPVSVEKTNKIDSTASLEHVQKKYPKWVIPTAEQQPETKPSTPKAEPTTTTETEAAPLLTIQFTSRILKSVKLNGNGQLYSEGFENEGDYRKIKLDEPKAIQWDDAYPPESGQTGITVLVTQNNEGKPRVVVGFVYEGRNDINRPLALPNYVIAEGDENTTGEALLKQTLERVENAATKHPRLFQHMALPTTDQGYSSGILQPSRDLLHSTFETILNGGDLPDKHSYQGIDSESLWMPEINASLLQGIKAIQDALESNYISITPNNSTTILYNPPAPANGSLDQQQQGQTLPDDSTTHFQWLIDQNGDGKPNPHYQTKEQRTMEILKSNLEHLSKLATSEDHTERLVAAVRYILEDKELLTKLANGKDLFVRQNPEDENPVLLSKPRSMYELSATVYYPTLQDNRVVKVIYNSIDPSSPTVEQQIIAHDNTQSKDYKYLNSKEIIENIPNDKDIEQVFINKGQQEQRQQSNTSTAKAEPKTETEQEKATLLNTIREKLAKLPNDRDGSQWNLRAGFIEPAMEPFRIKKLDELKTIINAIKNLDDTKLALYMKRYDDINKIIANGSDNTSHKLMKDLMISLSQYDGTGSIQDKFKDAFDALCKKYQEAWQESQGWDGLFKRLFRQPVKAIDQKVLTNPFMADTEPETQQQESTPLTPKAAPKTETEEVKLQSSPPSEEETRGQDDQQSEEPDNNIESDPPSTPQPQATLQSNLEALLKKAESAESSEKDHYKRLAAAIEFIQSNPAAMQKLATKKNILVVDHEKKNPVRFFWDGENLFSTVYYPKYNKNRFIEVCDNKIEDETKVFHSNKSLKALTPDKIIKEIESDNTFYRPEGQQSAQQQQTQSSPPVAQTRPNILETLKTKVSSLDDNTKKLGALGVVAVAAVAAAVGIMKNQASNSPQVKSPPSPAPTSSPVPTPPNSPGKNPEVNLGSAKIEKTEVVPKPESKTPKLQDPSINPGSRGSKLNKSVPYEDGVNRGASPPIQGDANKIEFPVIFKSKSQREYLQSIVRTRGSDGYNHLQANAEEIAKGGNVGGAALKDSGLSVFNGGVKEGDLQKLADALEKGDTLNQKQQGMIDKTLKALQQANGVGETPTLNTPAKKIEAIQNLQKAIGEKTDGHYQQIIGQYKKVLGRSVDVEPGETLNINHGGSGSERSLIEKITPKVIAGTPPPGAKVLTTAEMQANAAAVSHAPSGGGGFADAWNHVGQAMGAFAAVGGALTLMNWKHNHVLQNANAMLRTGAGIAGAVGASTPLGILAGAADVAYNMTNAALVSTTKGREAARQAYQDAKEQNNALKIGLGALRVVGSEVAYHKANALNLDKNRQRMTAAIETTKAVAATQWNNVTQTVGQTVGNAATKTQELQRTTGAKVAQYCETSKQTLEATCAKVRDNVMALLTFGRGARQALA